MERNKLKNIIFGIIVMGLTAALFLTFLKINELNNSINDLHQNINILSDTMRNNISDIYINVDDKLKKQSSILVGYDITYGPLDSVNYITPILFSVTPKNVTDSTEVSVTVADTTVTLNRNGEVFSGYIDTSVFIDDDAIPLVSVRSDGVTQNEYLENENMINLFTRYMPYLSAYMTVYQESFSNGKIRITGDFIVDSKPPYDECTTEFVRYFFVCEADGKEIYRKDITKKVQKANGDMCQIDVTFSADADGSPEYYIVATDSLGLTHKNRISCTYLGGDDSAFVNTEVDIDGWGQIYDKEGKLLYGY